MDPKLRTYFDTPPGLAQELLHQGHHLGGDFFGHVYSAEPWAQSAYGGEFSEQFAGNGMGGNRCRSPFPLVASHSSLGAYVKSLHNDPWVRLPSTVA
mmetsp:Transcript_137186/g.437707  ORF Transcript_137186/g.437707 Transcript_137186/m.437707 type:complete len:97 (-) Transcript_137186:181-471(-)